MKKIVVCLIFGCLILTAIYSLRGKPFVKVTFISIFGDRQLENTLAQYKVKFVPQSTLHFGNQTADGIMLTWAFRPSHAVPTYPIPVVDDTDHDGIPEVYIGSYSQYVYALNGKTGSVLWNWKLPFGVIGGRALELADLDNDGSKEIILGSHTSLPIRVYALRTGTHANADRLIWLKNISGDFLEGGLSLVKDPRINGPIIIAATRDAPYSRGSLNVIKANGTFLYPPVTGLDDCISRPAIGFLADRKDMSLIHGSHAFYNAKYAHRIVARDISSGKINWMSSKIGDTGFQNHQIVDVDFDGINEVVAFARVKKKERIYILNGKTGQIIREVPWYVQGLFKAKQRILVCQKDSTLCLDRNGKTVYSIPKISFGIKSDKEKDALLFTIAYEANKIYVRSYSSATGSLVKEYSQRLDIPKYEHSSDYGIFGQPSHDPVFLTLADTDNDKNWDALIQVGDFIINIHLPVKVYPGSDPYSPVPFRNIDNAGALYQ